MLGNWLVALEEADKLPADKQALGLHSTCSFADHHNPEPGILGSGRR